MTLDVGGVLAARITGGVVEHVLRPVSGGGAVLRIATASRATTLPDVTRLGLAHPAGRYLWTIEHLPGISNTDKLSGEDARASTASATSVARLIVLR